MVKIKKDLNTEQRILEAARKAFMHKGMSGARMQDIADEAGINKALLHYYFRNKDQLFEMVFKEAFTRFLPRLNQLIESDLGLFDKIETFVGDYIEMALQNPFLPLFVLNEMNKQPAVFFKKMWAGHPPKIQKLIQQINEEVKKGTIKKINPVHLVMNMLSLCVFPFVGKPMFQMVMHLDETQYQNLMQSRKKDVADFIIAAIKN